MHVQDSPGYNSNSFGAINSSSQGVMQSSLRNRNNTFQGGFGNSGNATLTLLILTLIRALLQSFGQTNPQQDTNRDRSDSAANDMSSMPTSMSAGSAGDEPAIVDNNSISAKTLFNTPVGATEPGPALPGNSYETTFTAMPGERLSFASMFVQSNDLFFAPDEYGIPLYDQQGNALEGDVTDFVSLWDAGTELNEPAGTGENQAPRQTGPNMGASDPDNRVRKVYDVRDELPAVNELVKAEIEYLGDNQFKLKLTNISDSSTLASPIAPGLAVVHSDPAPLFDSLQADRGLGLEALAEDGDPSVLFAQL